MKRPFFSLVSVLLLAACTASNSVAYELQMDVTDAQQRQQLGDQAMRVIERRLERMGEIPTKKSLTVDEDSAKIAVTVETQEAIDQLTTELQRPFDFKVMVQTPEGQEGEITVEGQGSFSSTSVTGEDLAWVEGYISPDNVTGIVRLVFTPEGEAKMNELFASNQGKSIGIFVRDQLVSKLTVDTPEVRDEILIRQIPSPNLAQIFAEDVNVGIHVTFTPVP